MDKNNYQNDMFPIHPNINENIKVLNNIQKYHAVERRVEQAKNYGLTKRSRRAGNVSQQHRSAAEETTRTKDERGQSDRQERKKTSTGFQKEGQNTKDKQVINNNFPRVLLTPTCKRSKTNRFTASLMKTSQQPAQLSGIVGGLAGQTLAPHRCVQHFALHISLHYADGYNLAKPAETKQRLYIKNNLDLFFVCSFSISNIISKKKI